MVLPITPKILPHYQSDIFNVAELNELFNLVPKIIARLFDSGVEVYHLPDLQFLLFPY